MPHGKTNLMRNIRKPAPTRLHEHTNLSGWDRRHIRLLPTGEVANLTPVTRRNGRSRGDFRIPAVNVPYRRPDCDGTTDCQARDHITGCDGWAYKPRRGRKLRLGRRLRKELL
jgi:hypothetical protein